jgi:uncharacterized Zn-binding protein involved in type VI secretion
MAKKTACPITRHEFRTQAKPITVTIAGVPQAAEVKEFSTGSLGWYLNGKTTVEINGTPVAVQIGMNLTIVGSKELPSDTPVHEPMAQVA